MKYFIKQMILEKNSVLPIDLQQFNELKLSRKILISAKAIEEKYDLLIQNYLEFEQEILIQLTRQMIDVENSYDDFYKIKSILNRRIVNLLTSTKLYYDQSEKHVRICFDGSREEGNKAKAFFSVEYDAHAEYRFMEALRNYVQHYGLAIHKWSLPINWEGDDDQKQMSYKIRLYTLKSELLLDRTFKKKTLTELDDETDLIKSIRIYIAAISNINNEIRKQIKTNVMEARDKISYAISNYESVNKGDSIGAYIYSVKNGDPSENPIEQYPLMLDWDNVRVRLEQKNQAMPKLNRWYISGSCL